MTWPWKILLVGVYAIPSVLAWGAVAAPTREEIALLLADREKQNGAIATTIVVTIDESRDLKDADPWPEDSCLERRELHWLSNAGRIRIDSVDLSLASVGQSNIVAIWNGQLFGERREATSSVILNNKPALNQWTDCLPLFNECDGPTFAVGSSLSELFRVGQVLESSNQEGESHYTLTFDPGHRETIEVVLDGELQPRLKSLTINLKGTLESKYANEAKLRIVYHVDEWSTFDGVSLPKRAYRDGYLFHSSRREAEGRPPLKGRTEFLRFANNEAKFRVDQSAQFQMEFHDGDQVMDSRYLLRYQVGSDKLMVDDAVYHVDEPLHGDVGSMLPHLLHAGAKPIATVITQRSGYTPIARDATLRAIECGGAVFIISLGGCVILSKMKRRVT